MIKEANLHTSIDYSQGQKDAAYRVLVELCSLFEQYNDDIRIVGGWVPELMFPKQGHVGSVDVDVLINHLALQDEGYLTMTRILLDNGYHVHPEKYFSFLKQVVINGARFDVDVDILAGMYGGTDKQKRSLTEQVYHYLCDSIIGGQFNYGDMFSTKQLAQELSVSMMPIREALKRLEVGGLVEIRSV